MLLSSNRSSFSIHATEPILPDDTERQEHLARTITRVPLRMDTVQYCYDSYVAEVVDLHATNGGAKVDRVVAVVDCGQVVNPDLIEAQFEGGVAFALSATMMQEITLSGGRVQQGSFTDFGMLPAGETPTVETHILANDSRPGGIGEVPISPTMPAVAIAYFAATGERIRRVPMFGG